MKMVRDLIHFFFVRSPMPPSNSTFGHFIATCRGFGYWVAREMSLWKVWALASAAFGAMYTTLYLPRDSYATSILASMLALLYTAFFMVAFVATGLRFFIWLRNSPRVLGGIGATFFAWLVYTMFAYPEAWVREGNRVWDDPFHRYAMYFFGGCVALGIIAIILTGLMSLVSRYYHRKNSPKNGEQ